MKTLREAATVEVEIKRSLFIAHAARVENLQDTLDFYESVADPAATHNCWAWKLGHQYRFNDDGEPASSAGKPIFSMIEGKDLDNVMVVVTRYFGGIKLGVGGLIRAYGGTAARSLDKAGIIEIEPVVACSIEAPFRWTGQVYAALEQAEARKTGESFTADAVRIGAELPEARFPFLCSSLRDATRGEAVVRKVPTP